MYVSVMSKDSDPVAVDQPQVQLQQSEDERQLFLELDYLLRSLESAPEPIINQNDGLDIPANIRRISMTLDTPTSREECLKLVNTYKLLTYACYKLFYMTVKIRQ